MSLLNECLATEGQCLYLLGDHLYNTDFKALAERASRLESPADIEGTAAGLWHIHEGQVLGHSLTTASGATTHA